MDPVAEKYEGIFVGGIHPNHSPGKSAVPKTLLGCKRRHIAQIIVFWQGRPVKTQSSPIPFIAIIASCESTDRFRRPKRFPAILTVSPPCFTHLNQINSCTKQPGIRWTTTESRGCFIVDSTMNQLISPDVIHLSWDDRVDIVIPGWIERSMGCSHRFKNTAIQECIHRFAGKLLYQVGDKQEKQTRVFVFVSGFQR